MAEVRPASPEPYTPLVTGDRWHRRITRTTLDARCVSLQGWAMACAVGLTRHCGLLTMTSREIAELVDSTHDSVLKTIRRLIHEGVVFGNETPYTHNGNSYTEYLFGKRDSMKREQVEYRPDRTQNANWRLGNSYSPNGGISQGHWLMHTW